MCTSFARNVREHSPEQELIDATGTLDAFAPAPREQLMKEMHLVDSDGTVRTGPDAVLTSLSYRNRLYVPISRLIRIWPFSLVARMMYRLVAKHRHLLSRLK